jgi:hypothetical protein
MATLTGGQIKDWLAGMDELTPRTRNNQMVDLHAAFATAKTWNLISENPLAGVQKFNVLKAPKIGILTPEQLSAFMNVVQLAMENAVEKAGIEWPHNCLRHSFCSYAVALHGFTWTSVQADHFAKNVEGSLSGSHNQGRS